MKLITFFFVVFQKGSKEIIKEEEVGSANQRSGRMFQGFDKGKCFTSQIFISKSGSQMIWHHPLRW
jgi:hypothetical protein